MTQKQKVLECLREYAIPMTAAEVAKSTGLTKTAASVTLSKLVTDRLAAKAGTKKGETLTVVTWVIL